MIKELYALYNKQKDAYFTDIVDDGEVTLSALPSEYTDELDMAIAWAELLTTRSDEDWAVVKVSMAIVDKEEV